MRDPYQKKQRDLRRIARSSGYAPSIFDLFHKYHPEVREREEELRRDARANGRWYWLSAEWHILQNLEHDWATKIAGCWNSLGGAPPSHFRRGLNRQLRAKQKAALQKAIQDEDWDFVIPPHRRNCRWLYW